MDIKHEPHKHKDGSEHKTIRIYVRKKSGRFYNYIPVGMMCEDCGKVDMD